MIAEIETALVERLTAALGPFGIKVEPFPEKPDDYLLTHPVGVALVVFRSGELGAPKPTDLIVQTYQLTWEITLLVRNLRTWAGAYPLLDAIRQSLTGWRAPNCRPAYGSGIHFQGQKAGVWQYAVLVATPTTAVEVVPDPAPRPGPLQLSIEPAS